MMDIALIDDLGGAEHNWLTAPITSVLPTTWIRHYGAGASQGLER
jgi:hypothetical protein